MKDHKSPKTLRSPNSPTEYDSKSSYDEALNTLFSLVSNQTTIESWKKERREDKQVNLNDVMCQRLKTLKVDIERMNCIHITGTKGKGSTAAFVECILRQYGFRTGLYTSPHLVDVRERIRINGQMMSKKSFADYFWTTYNRLQEERGDESPLPPYFQFLTLMGFLIFQEEKVDVAVVEVGIGGRTDSTNVVVPSVCAISPIGYDHMEVLGDTLTEIAIEKAGIFKKGASAVSCVQTDEVMHILKQRALDLQIPLIITPQSLENTTGPNGEKIELGLEGDFQQINASIAIESSRIWLSKQFKSLQKLHHEQQLPLKPTENDPLHNPLSISEEGRDLLLSEKIYSDSRSSYSTIPLSIFEECKEFYTIPQFQEPSNPTTTLTTPTSTGTTSLANESYQFPTKIPSLVLQGLKYTKWPGRAQTVSFNDNIDFCLDGAHTSESISVCLDWYKKKVTESTDSNQISPKQILIFNCKQNRDSLTLIKSIIEKYPHFDEVIFTTNNLLQTPNCDLSWPENHLQNWNRFMKEYETKHASDNVSKPNKQRQHIFTCVASCVSYVDNLSTSRNASTPGSPTLSGVERTNSSPKCMVLVTGSLYLVGAFLEYFGDGENLSPVTTPTMSKKIT